MLCTECKADSSVKPITPDYGGPVVSYADGVFDSRFDRFIAVREGSFWGYFVAAGLVKKINFRISLILVFLCM